MIIPYGHDRTVSRFPWLTVSLIALCTIVHLYGELVAPEIPEGYVSPRRVDELMNEIPILKLGYLTGEPVSYRIVTSAFVHGGWLHLIGNMLFLWLAGSALEDRLGRLRYLGLYLAGAVASTYAFELAHGDDRILLVGASGAISALMGAFLVYFSRTQIMLWYFIMFRTGTFHVPAYVALPCWLAEQFALKWWDKAMGMVSPVAYEAHIGGFVFGLAFAFAIKRWVQQADEIERAEPRHVEPSTRDRYHDEREQRLRDAIERRDANQARLLASRVIIDLGRRGEHPRALELARLLSVGLPTVELTAAAKTIVEEARSRR